MWNYLTFISYTYEYIYILAINTENGRKLTKLKKDENEREKWKRKQCETVVTNCWTVWQHIRKLANRFHSKDCFRILCSFCFLFITYPSYSFIFIIFIYCIFFFIIFIPENTLCLLLTEIRIHVKYMYIYVGMFCRVRVRVYVWLWKRKKTDATHTKWRVKKECTLSLYTFILPVGRVRDGSLRTF